MLIGCLVGLGIRECWAYFGRGRRLFLSPNVPRGDLEVGREIDSWLSWRERGEVKLLVC